MRPAPVPLFVQGQSPARPASASRNWESESRQDEATVRENPVGVMREVSPTSKVRVAAAILAALALGFVWLQYFAAVGPVQAKLTSLAPEVDYWRSHRSVVYPEKVPGARVGLLSNLPTYVGYKECDRAQIAYNVQADTLGALRRRTVNNTATVGGIGGASSWPLLFVPARRKNPVR